MLAVADGRPETLGLKSIIEYFLDFQFEIATRKYRTLLAKELEKKEIQEGLIKACDVIDLIIEILRGSQNLKQAKDCLVNASPKASVLKQRHPRKQPPGFILPNGRHQRFWKCVCISSLASKLRRS